MASSRNNRKLADPFDQVSRVLDQHVRRDDRLIAGLSGGVDSVFLLHVLSRLSGRIGFRLGAMHVHHGLSSNADQWSEFCDQYCKILGVPLELKKVVVRKQRGESLEAAARRVRYAAFSSINADFLALAHHRDDQAETLLLNLFRGAGWAGASAMPVLRECRDRPDLHIIRPLLKISRREIESAANGLGLSWIEDESNRDTRHTRNFLRHLILPSLRERFPGCDATLARAAEHFAEGEKLLDQLAESDTQTVLRNGRIVIDELRRLEMPRARNLLRHLLKKHGVEMPDADCLNEALRQVCHAADDRQVSIDLGDRALRRYRGEIWLVPHIPASPPLEWHGEAAVSWSGRSLRFDRSVGQGIALDRLMGKPVTIRARQGGERFRPDVRRPRRELKKLLQELGIPSWQRSALPLLWSEGELVWVAGVGTDCDWQCRPGEPGLLPIWPLEKVSPGETAP